jgi:hypothetical protein
LKKLILFLMLNILISSASSAILEMDGFDKIIKASNSGKYICFNQKLTQSYWERPIAGKGIIIWQTPVVPASNKGGNVIFTIACGLGTSKGTDGTHMVFINNKKFGQFNVCIGENIKWNNGTISFQGIYLDKNNDLFGIMKFTVPSSMINYGKSQIIKVQGGADNVNAWFMLSAIKLPSKSDIKKEQKTNDLSPKIKIVKMMLKRFEAEKKLFSTPSICKWFKNKKAAVSIANSIPLDKDITVFHAAKNSSPDAAFKAVDKAVENKSWLIELWPQNKVPQKHSAYLTALECVIWRADTKLVQDYIFLRDNLKVQQKRQKDIMTIYLRRMPGGKLKNIPITVYVPSPAGITWVKITASGKKIPIDVTSEEHLGRIVKKGFVFSLAPVDFPAVLKLEK